MRAPRQVMAGTPSAVAWLGFLSPEDVVSWKEPAELQRGLGAALRRGDDEAAFAAANRLALEAFRAREAAIAAEVCQWEIGYAAARLARGHHARTAMLGLQPVVNLIRLNGYSGDLALARYGLGELERFVGGQPVSLLGLDLSAALLTAMGAELTGLRLFARANCLIETAKILWRRGLPGQLREECARLCEKWPGSGVSGPFHAFEAAWLTSPPPASVPGSPTLQRLRLLHQLSWTPEADAARELFRLRERDRPGNVLAAARQLAALGDCLQRLADEESAGRCLSEAHSLAAPADPVLANLIRMRWLELTATPEPVPPALPCPRLSREDLAELSALAATRFSA